MKTKKLKPLEILRQRKTHLKVQSDVLADALNNHLNYLQNHWGLLLRKSAIDAVWEGALAFLPFLLKGKKAWVMRWVLNRMKKWVKKWRLD